MQRVKLIMSKAMTSWVALIVFTAFFFSCASSDSTSSRITKIPFEEQYVRGVATKLAFPLPTDNSKDTILIAPSYPNPFSPSTTIDFNVGDEDTVTIYFYDVDGKIISEAYRGYLLPGVYRFKPTELHVNSGVYFVKFQLSNRSSARKVMILR